MTLSAGALRADPGFRRYVAARVVSMAGSLLTAVVLPVLVYRLTGSAMWTAAVVVAEALPHLLLAPPAAAVANWLNRRRLLYVTDLAGAALLGSIPLAWGIGVLSEWHVLAVACAVQTLFVVLDTAQTGALQTLVGSASTAAGRTALRGSTGLAELMVPPLAGLAVVIVAPAGLLTLDAASFLASALLVRAAMRCRPDGAPVPAERMPVRSGLRFLRTRSPSRALAVAATLHGAAAAAYLAILLPWAERHLGVAPSGDARLALVVSCWGLGALGGCSLFPALLRRLGSIRLVRRGAGLALACGLAVLLCIHWLPAVLAATLWGAAHSITTGAALHALGRPTRPATRMLLRGLGPAVGAALAGTFAVWHSPRTGLAVGVALLAVAVAVVPRGAVPSAPEYFSLGPSSPGLRPPTFGTRGSPAPGSVPTQPGPAGERSGDRGRDHSPRTLADRAGHGDVASDHTAPCADPQLGPRVR